MTELLAIAVTYPPRLDGFPSDHPIWDYIQQQLRWSLTQAGVRLLLTPDDRVALTMARAPDRRWTWETIEDRGELPAMTAESAMRAACQIWLFGAG